MINSGFENGTGQSRKKNTRSRYVWKLNFISSKADYLAMETFFNDNKGDTIQIVCPWYGTTHLAKMQGDEITATPNGSSINMSYSIQVNEI